MWYLNTLHDLSPPPSTKPLSPSSHTRKWQYLKSDKTWDFILVPPLLKRSEKPSPLPVWNLISAAWSVWEFGPRQVLLVTSSCERPAEKHLHTCPYFPITQPAHASKTVNINLLCNGNCCWFESLCVKLWCLSKRSKYRCFALCVFECFP